MQRPSAAGELQTSHAPLHAESQQYPSTQKPLLQSAARVQVGVCGQLLELPLHTYGAHEGPPGTPASLTVQVPLPQPSHAPSQRVSQHTPSTQWPETHCASPVHGAASAPWALHPVGSQYSPAAQRERSAGHRGPPVQRSSRSHSPTAARHVVPSVAKESGEQAPLTQFSATSHPPAPGLHNTPSQSGSAQSLRPSASSSRPSSHRNSCAAVRTASPSPSPVEGPASQRPLAQCWLDGQLSSLAQGAPVSTGRHEKIPIPSNDPHSNSRAPCSVPKLRPPVR